MKHSKERDYRQCIHTITECTHATTQCIHAITD